MLSLYDGTTEYILNKRLAQKAQDDHRGGYYAYRIAAAVKSGWENKTLVPQDCYEGVSHVALLECEISGTIVEYGSKIAATYLKPVKVVEIIEVS